METEVFDKIMALLADLNTDESIEVLRQVARYFGFELAEPQ